MSFFGSLLKGIAGVGKAAVGSLVKSTPVGAVASAGLDALGSFASDSQNQANQMALQQQGQQWQEHIIDKQNEWNSAPAQAERYRQAGINPVLALGGGSSGIVSSGGSSGVNSSVPVSDSVAISNEQRAYQLQSRIADADIEAKQAAAARSRSEAETEDRSRTLKLLGMMKNNDLIDANTAKSKAESLVFGEEASFLHATQTPRREVEFSKMTQETYRTLQMFADAQIAQFNASVVDKKFNAELASIYAQIALSAKQGSMYDAMSQAELASSYLQRVLGDNQNYSEEQRAQLLKSTIDQIKNAAISSGIDVDWKTFDKVLGAAATVIGGALSLSFVGKTGKVFRFGSKLLK